MDLFLTSGTGKPKKILKEMERVAKDMDKKGLTYTPLNELPGYSTLVELAAAGSGKSDKSDSSDKSDKSDSSDKSDIDLDD